MKKYLIAAVTCFAVCSLFLGTQAVSAAAVEVPFTKSFTILGDPGDPISITDIVVSPDSWPENIEFGMYVLGSLDGGGNPTETLILLDDSVGSGILTFTGTTSGWTALYSTGSTLDIGSGDTPVWGFYFKHYIYNPITGTISGETYYTTYKLDGSDADGYVFEWEGATASVAGTTPIPLPTASLLLGTGIVGLFGFRRRYSVS